MNTKKTVIITGSNTGLGLECARDLLARNDFWHIVLAVREPKRGAAAACELGAPDRCTVMACDLASLQSVRSFNQTFSDAGLPPLHAIVCNAGVQMLDTQFTVDDIEMTFGVNHLGHFALIQGLVDQLVDPARIVVVSSGTHDPAKFTGMPHPNYTSAEQLAHPASTAPADGRRRYTTSKLCNMLFAYELDRKLDHGARGITVTAFDPGMMPGSGLAREASGLQQFAWRYVLPALRILPNVNSVATSGQRLARLVDDPALDGITGTYFEGRNVIRSSADSYDVTKAHDLWETSLQLADLPG